MMKNRKQNWGWGEEHVIPRGTRQQCARPMRQTSSNEENTAHTCHTTCARDILEMNVIAINNLIPPAHIHQEKNKQKFSNCRTQKAEGC